MQMKHSWTEADVFWQIIQSVRHLGGGSSTPFTRFLQPLEVDRSFFVLAIRANKTMAHIQLPRLIRTGPETSVSLQS